MQVVVWLLKLYALILGLGALSWVKDGLFMGIVFLVLAVRYAELDAWQRGALVPPYLKRFPLEERRLIDNRFTGLARAGLGIIGLLWTYRALYRPLAVPLWQIPGITSLAAIWFGAGMLFLTVTTLANTYIARKAVTYEHFQMEAATTSRWLFILSYALAWWLSYTVWV